MPKPAVKHDFAADTRDIHGIGPAETTREPTGRNRSGFQGSGARSLERSFTAPNTRLAASQAVH